MRGPARRTLSSAIRGYSELLAAGTPPASTLAQTLPDAFLPDVAMRAVAYRITVEPDGHHGYLPWQRGFNGLRP